MLKSAPVLLPLEDEGRLLVRAEAGPEESVLLSLQDPGPAEGGAAGGAPGRASVLRFLESAFARFPEARELELAPDLAATLCAEGDDIPAKVAKIIADNRVVVFSKSYCPFCMRVKSLFQ